MQPPHKITEPDPLAMTGTCSVCGPRSKLARNGTDRHGAPRFRCFFKDSERGRMRAVRTEGRTAWWNVGPGATADDYAGALTPRAKRTASEVALIIADMTQTGGMTVVDLEKEDPTKMDTPATAPDNAPRRLVTRLRDPRIPIDPASRRWRSTVSPVTARRVVNYDAAEGPDPWQIANGYAVPIGNGRWRASHSPTFAEVLARLALAA